MYVCIYIHICIYIYLCICIYIYICIYIHICIHIHIHIYIYTSIYIYTYKYIYMYITACLYFICTMCAYIKNIYIYIYILFNRKKPVGTTIRVSQAYRISARSCIRLFYFEECRPASCN